MLHLSILCFLGVLGTNSSFYELTPFQQHDREGAAGCGVIEGRVVDQTGQPVDGVKVSSMITDRPPRGRQSSSVTDAEGRFKLTCVEPGSNRVFASKEDENYPDTFLSPLVDAKFVPVVTVADQAVTGGVEVRLPPKGGKLLARVIDAVTQQSVEGASIKLCRADDPTKCLTINATSPDARFEKVVPAIRFTVRVSASAYKDWYYEEGTSSRARTILLTPGSIKELTIPLRLRAKKVTKPK